MQLTCGEHSLIIDPFLTGNQLAKSTAESIQVQHILITHAHADHVGDALAIARRLHATIICNFDLALILQHEAPDVNFRDMQIGGKMITPFGRVKMTIAHHGSTYESDPPQSAGPSTGFVVTLGGMHIYHAGDTGLFLDMKLIGELDPIDLACLPIGDLYTMGIDDAAHAVSFLNPRYVLPIHYNTFPVIQADVSEFEKRSQAKCPSAVVWPMKPGEIRTLS